MRIDRIRIRSLASLHGVQPDIDLSGPDLGQAGLVAITGPTGAGKSTILDALCLALYGRTPRLERQAGELLARDAQDGSASVDLTLSDGSRWSASWSLRRTRSGEISRPAMQVVDAGGSAVAEGVQAVSAWSTRSLGLSFDQFRGVVLLPQFEFARFLGGNDAERSALLEKLTGTGIYARLSQAAFLANQQAATAVQTHEAGLVMLVPLGEAERVALDAHVGEAENLIRQATVRVAEARSLVAWHDECARLALAIANAAQRHAAATAIRQHATTEAGLLARSDAAEDHVAALTTLDQAEIEVARLVATTAELQAAHTRSHDDVRAASTRVASLEASLVAAITRSEHEAGTVALLAALPLADLIPAQDAATAALSAMQQVRDQEAAAARSAAQVHLAAQGFSEAQAKQAAVAGEERTLRAAIDEQLARLDVLAGAGGIDGLSELVARANAAHGLAAELTAVEPEQAIRTADAAEQALLQQAGRCAESRHRLAIAESEVEVARARRDLAVAQARAAALRPQLQSGEPCPLCGSPDHPWAQHPLPDGDLLASCDRNLHDASVEVQRARALDDAAAGEATRLSGAAAAARAMATAATARHGDLARRYAQHSDLSGLPAVSELAAIHTWHRGLQDRLDQARRCEAERLRLASALHAAQQTGAAAAATLELRGDAQAAALAAHAEMQARLAGLVADRAHAQECARAAVAALASRLAEPRPEQASAWLNVLPSRIEAARATIIRARMLADLGAELLVQARASRGETPLPETTSEDGDVLVALRSALSTYSVIYEQARRDAEALRQHEASLVLAQRTVAELDAALRQTLLGGPFVSIGELRAARIDPARRSALRARLRQLDDDIIAAAAACSAAEHQRREHPPWDGFGPVDRTAAQEDVTAAEQALAELHHRHGRALHAREQDDVLRDRRAAALAAAGPLLDHARQARALYELIGHKDGEVFRRFAQALTLDQLLLLANHRLASLQPRYALARTPSTIGSAVSLELDVIDHDQAGERRPVATLSGGESFLVSLALSLALADLQGGGLRLGTLFIDEGFGSLDPTTLERCLAILERLQQEQGTQIVVISHVGALHERLAHRIEVQPWGHGRSRVRVVWPGGMSEALPMPESEPTAKRRRIRRSPTV